MKNLSIYLAVILSVLTFSAARAENMPIGTWQFHGSFPSPPQKVIDAGKLIYYTSGDNLYSYNTETEESYSYNIGNKLTDSQISDIFYNSERKYLFIAYASGNIDILYDNGRKVNISDIKETSITPPLTINSVWFSGDTIYVATVFGLVEINEPKAEILQSAIWNKEISSVCIFRDKLVIADATSLYYIDPKERIGDFSKFTKLYDYPLPYQLIPYKGKGLLAVKKERPFIVYLNFDDDLNMNFRTSVTFTNDYGYSIPVYTQPDGEIFFAVNKTICTLSENFLEKKIIDLPEEMSETILSFPNGLGSVWSLTDAGLGHYSFDELGNVTELMGRFRPDDFPVGNVGYFHPSADGKYLYTRTPVAFFNRFNQRTDAEGLWRRHLAARINLETGETENQTLYPVETRTNVQFGFFKVVGKYASTVSGMALDPFDPDRHYLSSQYDGVLVVKDGKHLGTFDSSNTPLIERYNRAICYGINVDQGGNLWVGRNGNGYTYSTAMVLPAEKLKLDPSEITADDWYVPDFATATCWFGHETIFFPCKKSNMILMSAVGGGDFLMAYDTRGTFNDFSDDRFRLIETIKDQDGKEYSNVGINSYCEDLDGKVWMGCNDGGVFVIQNASKCLDPDMTITRVKVPRNDGSGLADYLIGTDRVQAISVDAANRKWIATENSGLYVVSPDGSEILERFTPSNSPLLTNQVNAVYCDPNSSTVYIGTSYGLFTYGSDATPAAEDFSDIVAYPNPVRPDYSGDIYVKGLMDGSLVKIADTAGRVLYQGRSEGGLFTWSGCNAAGVRVPSGVYYVFVSHGSGEQSSSGAVAKIVVIK